MDDKPQREVSETSVPPSSPHPGSEATVLMEGMLVGGDDERIDIVVTPYLLSLEREAVVAVEALPEPQLLLPGMGTAVRLRMRAGARLFAFSSSADLEAQMWRRRSSFAVGTRSAPPEQTPQTEQQLAATRAFLAKHGIRDDAEEDQA
jgi:hypothetical protein